MQKMNIPERVVHARGTGAQALYDAKTTPEIISGTLLPIKGTGGDIING